MKKNVVIFLSLVCGLMASPAPAAEYRYNPGKDAVDLDMSILGEAEPEWMPQPAPQAGPQPVFPVEAAPSAPGTMIVEPMAITPPARKRLPVPFFTAPSVSQQAIPAEELPAAAVPPPSRPGFFTNLPSPMQHVRGYAAPKTPKKSDEETWAEETLIEEEVEEAAVEETPLEEISVEEIPVAVKPIDPPLVEIAVPSPIVQAPPPRVQKPVLPVAVPVKPVPLAITPVAIPVKAPLRKAEPIAPVKLPVKAPWIKTITAEAQPVKAEPVEAVAAEPFPADVPAIAEPEIAAVEPPPAETPVPEITPEEAKAVPVHSDLTLDFAAASSEIPPSEQKKLDALVKQLEDTVDMRIQIRAYAKDDEGQSSARRMSLSRGLMVRAYLAEKGIKPARLDVRALGAETEPPVDRVDLVFVR